jgi:L-2-hydroxycarboxylate dehydrogenase (NAD+)
MALNAARDLDADHRFAAATTESFIHDVMAALGLPVSDACKVAQLMNEADLTGADAHGIFRLPQYARRIRAGGVNTKPRISVQKTAAATALVDGDNGMGHLVVSRAAETAIALASDAGIGWVGVRRSNHAGTAGLYAAMPVACGMIGIYSAVANANHMAVWGGSELLLGTNPLGIGLPSDSGPVVLDMATSAPCHGGADRLLQVNGTRHESRATPRARIACPESARVHRRHDDGGAQVRDRCAGEVDW